MKNTAKYTPMLKHNSEDTFSPAVDEWLLLSARGPSF